MCAKRLMDNPSGTSNLSDWPPDLLPYPPLLDWSKHPILLGSECVVVPYFATGISVLVARKEQEIRVRMGDFSGSVWDLENMTGSLPRQLLLDDGRKLVGFVCTLGLQQAQYYFGLDKQGLMLTDFRVSLNKFASPGMLSDLFRKAFRLQTILCSGLFSTGVAEQIFKQQPPFDQGIIVKPTRFQATEDGDPLYVTRQLCS